MKEISDRSLEEILESKDVVEALGDRCACGAPRVMSISLDKVVCSDPKCYIRRAALLHKVLLDIDTSINISKEDLEDVYDYYIFDTPLEVFKEDWLDEEEDEDSDMYRVYVELQEIKEDLELSDLLVLSGLVEIDTAQVYKLVSDVQTISELSDKLEEKNIEYVMEGLEMRESFEMPVAISVYNSLLRAIRDLEMCIYDIRTDLE